MKRHIASGFFVLLTVGAALAAEPAGMHWYKGNTHTHSWWSDGACPPELVVGWYREHGYNFLVVTDHNTLQEGEKWTNTSRRGREEAAKAYEEKYPGDWIQKRVRDGKTEYRLKTLSEFRTLFEKPGEFLLMPGEEISDASGKRPVHLCAINLKEAIPPQKGRSLPETIQNDVDAVLAQQRKTNQPMLVHLNHPNFKRALTVEDIIPVGEERFFEVHNGHPAVRSGGEGLRPSVERMWDIVLTKRLAELHLPVMYGLATDDAHNVSLGGNEPTYPGWGWVMVHAASLQPTALLEAMNRGDFYASTGVTLDAIGFRGDTLDVAIHAEKGVTYRTQFIGTLQGYDPTATSQPAGPGEHISMKYSESIGKVLAEVEGAKARYKLTGKEIYVRAKVISSRKKGNAAEFESAWVQPVQPARASKKAG